MKAKHISIASLLFICIFISCCSIKTTLMKDGDDNCILQSIAINKLIKEKFVYNKDVKILITDSLYFTKNFSNDFRIILKNRGEDKAIKYLNKKGINIDSFVIASNSQKIDCDFSDVNRNVRLLPYKNVIDSFSTFTNNKKNFLLSFTNIGYSSDSIATINANYTRPNGSRIKFLFFYKKNNGRWTLIAFVPLLLS